MIKPIVAFGDPVLKAEAEEIKEGRSGLSKLIEDMWETMYHAEGVGLASPQVGESIRMFVIDGSPFAEGENGDKGCEAFKRVMINPVIFDQSVDEISMEEGCLSIPGFNEVIARPDKIELSWQDLFSDWWGNKYSYQFGMFLSSFKTFGTKLNFKDLIAKL